MTAPRARVHNRPPSPPDRLPPRRGGSPSGLRCRFAGGLLRSAGALAAAALLALAAALALPATAEAQTVTTLVSNIGQGSTESSSSSARIAQVFTTGSSEIGYIVTGVDIVTTTRSDLAVKVCSLDNPTGLSISYCDSLYFSTSSVAGTNSFTPDRTMHLSGDSTYAVVVTPSREIEYGFTTVDTVDAGGADGWSIEAGSFIEDENSTDVWNSSEDALRIAIKGPVPLTVNVASAQASEGEDVTFTVTLSEPAGGYESVGWKWSIESDDTAVGADILFGGGGMRFAKWSTTGTFTVPTAEDSVFEDDETFTVTLIAKIGVKLGANPTAKGTILNDDEVDTTTPLLTEVRTSADGRTIFLEYDEAVVAGDYTGHGFSLPPLADAYSFSIDGVTVQTWHPEYGGTPTSFSIRLLLNRYFPGQTLVLSYDKSKAGALAIADASGNEVASFTTGSGVTPALVNISTVIPFAMATMTGVRLWEGWRPSNPVALTPPFVSGTTSYTADVAYSTEFVTVGMSFDPNQGITYEFLDADDNTLEDSSPVGGDFQVNVAGGDNVIKMKLTAEDGTTTQTTTLTVTRVARPPVPFAPTDFSVAPGNGEVALAWAAPASGVTRHEYRYRTTGRFPATWTVIPDSGRGGNYASGYTVARLIYGTAYTFQVRAVNDVGAGDRAESYPAVTPLPPLVVPTTCTLDPGDVWCGAVRVGEVAEASGKTIGYGFHETWHGAGVGGLPDGRIVYGANSYRINEAMVGVGATDRTDGFLYFGLNRAFPAADRVRLALYVGSDRFPLSDAHFESSTHTYHWRNTGLDWSSLASVTPRLRANLPSAPIAVRATAPPRTGGLLEVEWSAPAPARSITGYEVKYWKAADPENENRRSRTARTESAETSLLLYALLDADTEYKLRVRARNALGWGAWSEVATARTGAKQRSNPELSLAVVDENGADIDQITAGGTFRYRVKVTDLLNHHQSSGKDFTGWGTLGVRGPIAIEYFNDDVRYGCHGETLFLEDYTWESFTTGYWEFDSVEIPADAGPVDLQMGFACTSSHSETSEVARVTRTSKSFELGRPDTACLSVADSEGTVTACPAGAASARALKARFVSPPEHHDGSGRVKVRVAFSEAIEESPENVGEHGVKVEGGRVTSVRQVDNQPAGGAAGRSSGGQEDEQEDGERVWEFEIEPGSDDDLTMRIDGGRPCDEPGAICTEDGRSLSEGIATTVEGPELGPPALTASFEGLPEAHDGEDTFHFRVAFSEDIGIGFRTMRDESFTVDGGEVTGARRVDRRHDLWQITVEPDSDEAMTITLPAGRACAVSGAICTRGGDRRQLTNTATATVAGPVDEAAPAALTASFVEAPHEHDGETAFKLRIAFSEGISIGFRTFRDQSVSVSGGSVTHAKRVDRRKDLWAITVEPDTNEAVTLTLAGGRACGTPGAVCTGDGRALSAGISTTVLGPAALTVADARAKEGTDETIDFTVSLSRATRAAVTVAYATADGTATAGSDYTATSGTLTFAAGETEQTVSVPVLDDAHDEGEETLTLRLTNATGAVIADGEATGTIKNTDPLQRAWLARFGRTAATHVTDAVGERLRAGSGASHVTVGGYRLPLEKRATGTAEPGGATTEPETTTDRLASLLTGLAGMAGLGAGQTGGPGAEPGGGGPGWDAWPDAGRDPRLGQSHGVTLDLRRLLLGSSFRLNLGAAATGSAGPRLTAWGRVAGTAFDGREGNVSLNGDVLTGTVGVDGAWDRLLAGLAVAHSRGDGSFTKPGTADRGRGDLETTLTSIHPYLRYAVNDRLDMWGVLGYGRGHMEMEVATGETMETDMALVMGAFGGRGILLPAGETGGFELATRTDAMLTRTSSDAVAGMVSADAEAHRLRLVLEGSRGFAWAEGRSLTPTMEVGLRHDWGDAETGFGLELGGRVHYADPTLGLTIEAAVRGLLAHEDSDYQEWGASGSLRLAPGAGGRGLALTLAPTWGAASSGVNGLWSRQTTAGLAPQGNRAAPAGQLNAEVGYGFAPFDTGLLTPYAGTVLSDGAARTYRVGGRLQMRGGWATGLELNLEGTRQDPAGQQPVNQGLRLQLTWGF